MGNSIRNVALVGLSLCVGGCGWLGGYEDDSDADDAMPMDPGETPEPLPEPPAEEPFVGDCIPSEWQPEAGAVGAAVELELVGSEIHLEAVDHAIVERIEGPGRIAVNGGDVVAFGNATIDDALEGTLVVVGGELGFDAGELRIDGDAEVIVKGSTVVLPRTSPEDDGTRPPLPEDSPAVHVDALENSFLLELTANELQLTGYADAYVVTDAGERIDLTGPMTVSASEVYAPYGTAIVDGIVTAEWSGTAVLGLLPSGGSISQSGQALEGLPSVVFGFDPELRIGPDSVETTSPLTARVAMDDFGAVLPSTVELSPCEPNELIVFPGETRTLTLAYRQTGDPTDAIFAGLYVDVDGQLDAWPARLLLSDTIPAPLRDAAENNPGTHWGQGLRSFFEAIGEVTRAVAEGLTCVFTFGFVCPDSSSDDARPEPPSLTPYPAWMPATAVGTFQVELTAPSVAGVYEVEVHVAGENYDAIAPMSVVVFDPYTAE